MAAYRGSKSKSSHSGYKSPSYGEFKDRNLAGMSPEKAQNSLQPTPAEPVNMHKRMAGCK
jgi:hypothetical protein